jgi:hypothetical protein
MSMANYPGGWEIGLILTTGLVMAVSVLTEGLTGGW